jgi:cation diffusion facilitator CzcD-associated flavoprotein CzcO
MAGTERNPLVDEPRGDDGAGAADLTLDVAIVGAGFAGLYALHRMRDLGFSVRVYEAAGGVGGTWYWNRYPGARCDVESLQYSYSFSDELEEEWEWTERYASQPEILAYLEHVAERFDLYRDIQFESRISKASFDATTSRWTLWTNRNERISARFCVMATGCLSKPNVPSYDGLGSFEGDWFHTGYWPHEGVDFTGRKVAVIGTGSSAIQSIPIIARQARQLFVFQRTPNFSVPAHNAPLPRAEIEDWKAHHAAYRAQARENPFAFLLELGGQSALEATPDDRAHAFETGWNRGGFHLLASYADLLFSLEANATAAEFVRAKIRGIVKDPAVAEKLVPRDYPIGAKRLCIDTDYFATFNRDNVRLVDLREAPIERITPTGVKTTDAEYAVDSIVFAIGFDAMTGALTSIDIRGRDDLSLEQKWSDGPRAYLGLMAAGFPNLFLITGPGSPSVLSNMVVSIEQHVDWIADCLDYLRRHGHEVIEATVEAENEWIAHVNEVANLTVFPHASSWYVGANVPGKARVFMPYIGGVAVYRSKCDEVAANDYEGFAPA